MRIYSNPLIPTTKRRSAFFDFGCCGLVLLPLLLLPVLLLLLPVWAILYALIFKPAPPTRPPEALDSTDSRAQSETQTPPQ